MVGRHAVHRSRRGDPRLGPPGVVALWRRPAAGRVGAGVTLQPTHTTTTTSTTTLPATTLPPTTTLPATVTISAVGDTELGNSPQVPSDPAAYLANMRAPLAAQIVFGNLEGTMYDGAAGSKCGAGSSECYAFKVPTSFAAAYKATGFTVMNSANNHCHDFGDPGLLSTSAALRSAGLVQAGLAGPDRRSCASGRSRWPSSTSPPTRTSTTCSTREPPRP